MPAGPHRLDHRFVLLIDDEPTQTFQLGSVLRDAGARVAIAADHPQADELIERNARLGDAFDFLVVAVTDTPDHHAVGLDTVRLIRGNGFGQPIICLTPDADTPTEKHTAELRAACFDAGADEVLQRPLDPSEMLRTLGELLHHPQSRSFRPRQVDAAEIDNAMGNPPTPDGPGDADPDAPANRLLRSFLDRLPDRLERLQSAWREQNLLLLEAQLKQFKQSAQAHGYTPLTDEIRKVQQQIDTHERDLAEIEAALHALLNACTHGNVRPEASPPTSPVA